MSLTLGEKLRQAREARGINLSEVAEQTRISPLYIESIENDGTRFTQNRRKELTFAL